MLLFSTQTFNPELAQQLTPFYTTLYFPLDLLPRLKALNYLNRTRYKTILSIRYSYICRRKEPFSGE
jgi:hypothetical protein